jgi:hypothetical protein
MGLLESIDELRAAETAILGSRINSAPMTRVILLFELDPGAKMKDQWADIDRLHEAGARLMEESLTVTSYRSGSTGLLISTIPEPGGGHPRQSPLPHATPGAEPTHS